VLRKKQKPLPHYEPWRGGGAGPFGGGGGREFLPKASFSCLGSSSALWVLQLFGFFFSRSKFTVDFVSLL